MQPMRIIVYLWSLPTTMLGLLFVPLAIFTGGAADWIDGVLEIHGPAIRFLLTYCTVMRGGASAITLGHVVLGRDRQALELTRRHERIHVRQCERWGPLFIPVYLLASIFVMLLGRRAYMDNPFEREAYAKQ